MSCSVTGLTSSVVGLFSPVLLTQLVRGWMSGVQSGSLAISQRECLSIRDEAGKMGDGEQLLVGVRSLAGSSFVSILCLLLAMSRRLMWTLLDSLWPEIRRRTGLVFVLTAFWRVSDPFGSEQGGALLVTADVLWFRLRLRFGGSGFGL